MCLKLTKVGDKEPQITAWRSFDGVDKNKILRAVIRQLSFVSGREETQQFLSTENEGQNVYDRGLMF